jgi:hypothetical protein
MTSVLNARWSIGSSNIEPPGAKNGRGDRRLTFGVRRI